MGGALSNRHKKILPLLILDSTMFSFKTEEIALDYIIKRLGRSISIRTYRRYLRSIESGEFTGEWFNDYAIKGYALERIKLLSTAYMLRTKILEMMRDEADETKTPKWERDKRLEVQLMGELRAVSEMIAQLNSSTPVIAEIDARFAAYEKQVEELTQKLYKYENIEVLNKIAGRRVA